MSKKMLINATLPEEDRVAIVDDGVLTELDIEIAGRQQPKSNIYIGEVIRVEQGLQAAFVDYGAARPGFLQIGEIHSSLYPPQEDGSQGSRRLPINQILKRGQQILVQVVKEERGNKGAALTTEISLPGRYMVLMPESNARGISRKIDNESVRKGIKQALAGLELPENMGYIIRTAAIDQPPEELKRDFDYLLSTYNSIISHSKNAKAPSLIYQESNLVIRSIRDYFSPEIDEVLIDDRKVFQEARDFFKAVMPEYLALVKLHQERRPIFARYQIEEQIAQLSSNIVNLPSGGSIVLDQTEALVAIDVNSGKMSSEQDVEATAYRVNLEAATEVARQLRLRDMGGLIVIDFIDMRQRKNAREVEKTLKNALKIDKARVTVGRISSQFGLLEMSRQRIKANLGEGAYHQCPHCQGSGRIKEAESRSVALLRRIQAGTAKGNINVVSCTAALDVVNHILNNKRVELLDLEQRYNLKITINADQSYMPEQTELEFIKQNKQEQGDNGAQTPLVDIDVAERGNTATAPAEASTNEAGTEDNTPSSEESKGESAATVEKKRPRRRRRPNRRRNEQNSTENQTEDSATDSTGNTSEQEQKSAADNTAVTTDTKTAPPSDSEQKSGVTEKESASPPVDSEEKPSEAKKPARRRRTSSKKTQPTTINSDDVGQTQQADTPDAKPVEAVAQSETTDNVKKSQEAPVSTTSASAKSEEPEQKAISDNNDSTEVKKPVRRRRTTQKVATTAQTQDETATSTEKEDKTEAKTTKAATTGRKTTSRVAQKKTTDSAATAEENSAEVAEKKPVRRRRTVKKVVSETASKTALASADDAQTNNAVSTEASAAAAEEKTKKRPAARKRTTAKSKVDAGTSEQSSNSESTAAAQDATEKKPVRRRSTSKKAASETTGKKAASETTSKKAADETVEPVAAEKKPRRTSRKKQTTKTEPEDKA